MDALKLFQEYMGTGLIMIWFLISLLYLWLTEKRKHIRVMFLYVPLVLLFVFVIYRGSMSGRRETESGMKGTDSFFAQLRTLLIPMGGDILRDLLLLLPLWIGLIFFQYFALLISTIDILFNFLF